MGRSGDDDAIRMGAQALELYARWGAVRDPQALDGAIALLRRCRDLLPEGHPGRPMAVSNLCAALRDRYALRRDEADLDEAVDSGRRAVASAYPGDPNRWMYHGNLAGALNLLAQTRQSSADAVLDEAVGCAREAVRSAPQPVAVFHSHLGVALTARAARGGDGAAGDVRAAAEAFREAVRVTDPRDPQLAMYLTHLGVALHQRARGTTNPRERADDLGEALDHTRRAARLCSPDDPEHVLYLANLAAVISTKAEHCEETAEFDALVDLERRELAALPAEWRVRRMWLLVVMLRLRYDRTGEPRAIDEAVALCREALRAGEGVVVAPYLHELGSAYLARFRQSRDPADGDAAVDFAQRAVSAAAGPERESAEGLLAEALAVRYQLAPGGADSGGGGSDKGGGAPAADGDDDGGDGDETLAALEAVRRRLPPGSAELALCLSELGLTYMTRAIRLWHTGAADPSEALDRAAAVLREAADLRVLAGAQALPVLFNLGRVLGLLYERRGDAALLDEAVRCLEEAVAIPAEAGGPESAKALSALGMALRQRAEHLDSVPDLHRAVDLTGQAVEALPPGHPERALWRAHLCTALTSRYLRLNTVADLEEAVRVGREAVAAVPPGTPPYDRAVLLTSLGVALRRRYERAGAFADLDEAVEVLREAVGAVAPGSDGAGEAAVSLCLALADRYERTQAIEELDEAIDAGRLAVHAYPQGHARRFVALSNLALVLLDRCRRLERRGDADEALRCCQEAADTTPGGHPVRGRALLGLSMAFLTRYELTLSAADLEGAIEAGEAALRAVPDDDVRRVSFLIALATAHSFAAIQGSSHRDLEKACALFREAAGVEGVPAKVRFSAAAHWGLRAALLEDWAQAVDAYQVAVAQLPLMAWHGLELEDRISGLAVSDSIACDAAAAALSAGRPDTALHLLEQGRGVLLAQAVDSRFDLTALEEQEPRLAHRIAEIRSVLHSADSSLTDPTAPVREQRAEAHRHRELAAELDQLTRDAYRLLGLDDLLRPPSPEELREAAGDGTVVVVNTSFLRCDALVVTRGALRTVPLPGLSLEGPGGLKERTEMLLAALSSASRSPDEAGRALRDTLEWLRETVVEPVLAGLGPAKRLEPGRLWWCPTGLLALLPLHAAGELPERYVCSYTTTLRSLAQARRRQDERDDRDDRDDRDAGERTAGGVLIVDQAHVPGLQPLPFARKEALRLVTQVKERKLLAGPAADRRAVRRALPNHSCLHFAGHARHDPARPARSGLFCHGDQQPALLTVEDIARLRLDAADLAFLSACETARGTAGLPDEALHLAGALQLAGFTHVVAAQWMAEDMTARELTARFYSELRRPDAPDRLDPARSAFALHTAVRRIRQQNDDPLLWAAYVHTGP
ncbi:CHAT domain-containing protein [Streptomyces bluensis]|uniref:CHAT domain-containing protein n=1 Tax=Streptomyces bluensis TaxID=33897 RepID=A0ABW6U9U1_9ACTN